MTPSGRKNWGAIGHPKAGWHYAVLHTVLETCWLLNVNPESYLLWAWPQLSWGTNKATAKGLLPHDFAALFPEHLMPARRHYVLPVASATSLRRYRRSRDYLHAVEHSLSPSSAATICRRTNFWTFPVMVVGKASTNLTKRGIL
jgi:hypothetical protein